MTVTGGCYIIRTEFCLTDEFKDVGYIAFRK